MRLSDYFIGKPGPGCISEALAMRLPVIVERSVHTMIQERFNLDWIQENRVGIVFSSFSRIAGAVRAMLLPARHREDNQAVFEIIDILAAHLRQGEPHPNNSEPRKNHLVSDLVHRDFTQGTTNTSMFGYARDSGSVFEGGYGRYADAIAPGLLV